MPSAVSAPPPNPMRAIPVGEKSRLLVDVVRIRDGDTCAPASGRCQITVDGHVLGVHAGDHLQAFGQLGRIAPPLNPGEFDFADHARADRQFVRVRSTVPESITILAQGDSWSAANLLDAIRGLAIQNVKSFVGPERAGLAAAILLGAREGLSYEETESYLVTGTIHVLVVSGMNVAILAAGLWGLLRMGWLSRRAGLCLIVGVAASYAVLGRVAAAGCSGGRAGRVDVRCRLVGPNWCRIQFAICRCPGHFRDESKRLVQRGPQLSFLAVAVLIWTGTWPLLRKAEVPDQLEAMLAAARPWYRRVASAALAFLGFLLLTSLAVWLTSLPLVLNQFHICSPISVVISPVIWLFVWLAMWSGFGMFFGWLIPAIGTLCGKFCSFSLAGLETTVHWAESHRGPCLAARTAVVVGCGFLCRAANHDALGHLLPATLANHRIVFVDTHRIGAVCGTSNNAK